MKLKESQKFYIAINFYLVALVAVQLIVIPYFNNIYEIENTELSLSTLCVVLFYKYWYIFDPLMFIGANWLVKLFIEKYTGEEGVNEKAKDIFYFVLRIIIVLIVLGLAFALYLPIYTTGPPIK